MPPKSPAQQVAALRAACAVFEKNAEAIIRLAHVALEKARRDR